MPLALDENGNVLVYMHGKWVSQEEAKKIHPTNNKEQCEALKSRWEKFKGEIECL